MRVRVYSQSNACNTPALCSSRDCDTDYGDGTGYYTAYTIITRLHAALTTSCKNCAQLLRPQTPHILRRFAGRGPTFFSKTLQPGNARNLPPVPLVLLYIWRVPRSCWGACNFSLTHLGQGPTHTNTPALGAQQGRAPIPPNDSDESGCKARFMCLKISGDPDFAAARRARAAPPKENRGSGPFGPDRASLISRQNFGGRGGFGGKTGPDWREGCSRQKGSRETVRAKILAGDAGGGRRQLWCSKLKLTNIS